MSARNTDYAEELHTWQ